MRKTLRSAIEALLEDPSRITSKINVLREAYEDDREGLTETAKRIEFLQDCLETGVSKREAARMLVAHDPRIGQKTAETLVYFNFSGQYMTTRRGQRRKVEAVERVPLPDIEDDEAIL
jgi:hypothetical protein